MVKFTLRSNIVGQVYFPIEIRREWGGVLTYECIPNARAAIVFPQGESPTRVRQSLEIILADLRLRETDAGIQKARATIEKSQRQMAKAEQEMKRAAAAMSKASTVEEEATTSK